ncbi:MAG TPA: TetR/AcrR family transcriptional regulator [Spongiibacteraceae bacterium]|nr:TetR/AcrR family transcriptional regulator [Spongiibacteraceae bacterium]
MPKSKTAKKKAAPQKANVVKKVVEKKPRIRNPEQTRAKLLQATIDLLAEKGPDAVSLKEAARLAFVSRGVAYQHFVDRDHLLREAKIWMSDKLLESASRIEPALKEKNVRDVTEESVNSITRLVLQNREAARLLITDALAGKALDVNHPLYQLMVKDLEQLKNSGGGRDNIDIEMLTFIMFGSIATIIMMSHLPNAGNTDDLARRFTVEWTRFMREGMFAKTATKRSGAATVEKVVQPKSKATTKTRSGR